MRQSAIIISTILLFLGDIAFSQEQYPLGINVLNYIEQSGEYAAMFPFQPTDNAPSNITNVQTWAGVKKGIAGEEGFIISKDSHFVNEGGKEQRFFGTNLGMTGNFPSKEAADKLAEELSRYGINIVRVHWVSHRSPEGGYPSGSFFEPEQLDRFDYLNAKLKEKGIYLYFQLNIARKFGRVNGFPDANRLPYYKNGIDNVEPAMIDLQKRFHSEMLNHINPYTGIAYKDEPSIVAFELANENSIVHSWFSAKHKFPDLIEPYKSEIIALWNEWLLEKYGSTKAMLRAWTGVDSGTKNKLYVPISQKLERKNVDWPYKEEWKVSPQRAQDFVAFLYSIEASYFKDLYDNVKYNIGVKQSVTGTQLGYGLYQAQAGMDYCDIHGYWCHPAFPGGKMDYNNWNLRNGAIVNSYGHPGNVFTKLARSRILGLPFTVSEYDHPNLNFYCSEDNLMLSAMAAFQDWSGVMQFAWILDTDYDRRHIVPIFDMCSVPQKLVHLPACYAMFVRGDIRKASDKLVYAYPSVLETDIAKIAEARAADAPSKLKSGLLNSLPLSIMSGADVRENPELFEAEGKMVIRSEKDVPESIKKAYKNKEMRSLTGELTWNWQIKDAGYFMADSRNTKIFSGFVRNRSFAFRGMTLTPGKTRLDWLTLSLTLTEAYGAPAKASMLRSGTYLLAASGLAHNSGAKIVSAPAAGKISCAIADGGLPGTAPVLCEGIEAELALSGLANQVQCFALDENGLRTQELRVGANENGDAILRISPEFKTLWYELIIK